MVSDAQKKASAKWDKENMVVLACKVKRETAEQFKAACAAPRRNNPTPPGMPRTMTQRPGGPHCWKVSKGCKAGKDVERCQTTPNR